MDLEIKHRIRVCSHKSLIFWDICGMHSCLGSMAQSTRVVFFYTTSTWAWIGSIRLSRHLFRSKWSNKVSRCGLIIKQELVRSYFKTASKRYEGSWSWAHNTMWIYSRCWIILQHWPYIWPGWNIPARTLICISSTRRPCLEQKITTKRPHLTAGDRDRIYIESPRLSAHDHG